MPRLTVWVPNITTGDPAAIEIDTDLLPVPHGFAESLLVALVRMLQPRLAVEVGVMYGQTIVCLAYAMPQDGMLYGLDLKPECAQPVIEAWGLRDRITLIPGDSKRTALELPHGIAFAFIDGNHAWDFAESDGRAVWERMAPGGIVAFDDVNDPANDSIPGPAKAVLSLFGEDRPVWLQGGRGLALVQKPGGRRPIRLVDY